jgi:glutathione S-transferase
MKLYSMNGSHFASKCRVVIYEKGAPVEIVPIPGGDLKSPEYLKIYSMGKTPALLLNGTIIGESEIINEYLEEKFPNPPLLPRDPESRARARGLGRFHDLYLEPAFHNLFPQVFAAERDQQLIATLLAQVKIRLDQLEGMLSIGSYAVGNAFTLADCSLAPLMFYAQLTLQLFGAPAFTEGRPKLANWWTNVCQRPSVQKVHVEMQQAVIEMQAQANR